MNRGAWQATVHGLQRVRYDSLSLSLSDYHSKNLNVKFQKQNAMLCLLICSVVSDFLRPHGL